MRIHYVVIVDDIEYASFDTREEAEGYIAMHSLAFSHIEERMTF